MSCCKRKMTPTMTATVTATASQAAHPSAVVVVVAMPRHLSSMAHTIAVQDTYSIILHVCNRLLTWPYRSKEGDSTKLTASFSISTHRGCLPLGTTCRMYVTFAVLSYPVLSCSLVAILTNLSILVSVPPSLPPSLPLLFSLHC